MFLCYLLMMYQLVSAKLNFDTFWDNGQYSARYKARGPIFSVHVAHQYGL
jgi:hypothetical protein